MSRGEARGAGVGIAAVMTSTSANVDSIRRVARTLAIARAIWRA
jgi:hypothetical protein